MCDCISKINAAIASSGFELATKMTARLDSEETGMVLPLPVRKVASGRPFMESGLFCKFCPMCGEQWRGQQKPEQETITTPESEALTLL